MRFEMNTEELDFGLTAEEIAKLEEKAQEAHVSCEGGSEGDMG